jgi:hypothetical protein
MFFGGRAGEIEPTIQNVIKVWRNSRHEKAQKAQSKEEIVQVETQRNGDDYLNSAFSF